MRRLVFSLSEVQHSYLFDIKKRHGISMSAQIRSMIRDRIEGRSLYVETRPRTRPIYTKKTDQKYIPALNKELKAIFATMKKTMT